MRTIKFLVLAAGLATATPVLAQGGLLPGAFPGVDRIARLEARRFNARHLKAQRLEARRAAARAGFRAGFRQGRHAGLRQANRAGLRQALRADASPQQKAFREQLRAQRLAVVEQVKAGKLTREQAHTQLSSWITEHRPKK